MGNITKEIEIDFKAQNKNCFLKSSEFDGESTRT